MLMPVVPVQPAEAAGETIEVIAPNGGENIVSGETVRIRWSISGPSGYVVVQLSTDKGNSYDTLKTIPNTPSHGQGWWDWFVDPRINCTVCFVQVIWVDAIIKPIKELARDASDADFDVQPGLVIYFKEVPPTMTYGSYNLTTWEMFDPQHIVDHLRFMWRVDSGSGWGAWEPIEGGRFSDVPPTQNWIWWMPDYYVSAVAEVRLEAIRVKSGAVVGTAFTPLINIASPTVSLFKPDGGVVLVGGTDYDIEWRWANDPENVIIGASLDYSLNGGASWLAIQLSTENDGTYTWRVPSGVDSANVYVMVSLLYREWEPFASDQSSAPNRIVSDPNTLTVTLIDPNPPFDHGVMWKAGEVHRISWSTTGSNTDIQQFKLWYSLNSGADWIIITGATAPARSTTWTIPDVYSEHARCRVELMPKSGASMYSDSVHDFILFNTDDINRPPTARVVTPLTAAEDAVVSLDGSDSDDMDDDPLTYAWRQTSPSSPAVTITNADKAIASFSVTLTTFPVTFVFELQVSDGIEHEPEFDFLMVNYVTVEVIPRQPVITGVTPDTGWPGTLVTITGTDLKGCEVLIGGVSVGRVLTEPMPPLNPDPDRSFTFEVRDVVPHGPHGIVLRTLAGDVESSQRVEFFPEPTWQYDNGMGFPNPTTYTLSYPWDPWGTGRYRDAFGNDVYLSLWICIGLPWWDPWNGWVCLGYEIEEPFCPDPIAAIYYGAVFCWIARYGECFGMSSTALEFYHDEIYVADFAQVGADKPHDLQNTGRFDEHVDWRQGAQMSAEVLHMYLDTLIGGLVPSSPVSGMGLWEFGVKASIDSGDLCVATMICDYGAHAVVPYAYEDVDSTHTRFYVYDSNREEFSKQETSVEMAYNDSAANDNPPYIEIIKEGMYWDWSFMWPDGTEWRSAVGLAFVPWSVIHGSRTLPLSIEGILTLIAGSADVSVDDGAGGTVGYDPSGSLQWGIEGAAPLPQFSGAGSRVQSWYLPDGNYTSRVKGTAEGVYNWSMVNNGTSAFSIESAEVGPSSTDSIAVDYADGNPYRGSMRYGTNDAEKEYSLAMVNKFGVRERVYRIRGADLTSTGEHEVGTNGDYTGIVFTNHGTAPTTFDVEFQHNVVSDAVWNGTDPPTAPRLPTASRQGITVGPGETVTIRPLNWLDLDHTIVIIEGETVPGAPQGLTATATGPQVTLVWTAPASDGGWAVTGYVVLRGDAQGNLTTLADATGTTYIDAAVVRGTTYWYAVQARNALGGGPAAEAVSVTVPALTAPSAPTGLNVTEAGGKVTVKWAAPLDDGGSPVTGYKVLRGTSTAAMSELATVGAAVTTHMDTTAKKGRTYYYAVVALNSVGEGQRTPEVSASIPGDEGGGLPWLLIIVVIIVLLAVIGLAMWARGRGKGAAPFSSPPPAPGASLETATGPPPQAGPPGLGEGPPPG